MSDEYDEDRLSPFGRPFPAADWTKLYQGVPVREVESINASVWMVSYGKYKIGGSRWNRLRVKVAVLRARVADAWLVLRGKAEIDL